MSSLHQAVTGLNNKNHRETRTENVTNDNSSLRTKNHYITITTLAHDIFTEKYKYY